MRQSAWTVAVLLLTAAGAPAQIVTIGQDFTGSTLPQGESLTGLVYAPPDSDGTVGPNHFVEFINGIFAVYNKSGNPSNKSAAGPIIRTSGNSFWNGITNDGSYGTINNNVSDTRVRFDPNSNRYYAVQITTANSNNLVLVARTAAGADPSVLSNWKATSYTGRSGQFADYPTLGFDANAIYISTNNSSDVTLTSIPKTDLNAVTPTVANRTTVNRSSGGTGTGVGFTAQPVIDWAPTKGAGVFIGTVTNGTLRVTNPTGTGAAGANYGSQTSISVSSFSGPQSASQPDGTRQLDALDGRQPSAAYQVGNDIWAVHSVAGGGINNRAALRWYHLNYANNTLIASGTISDPAGNYDYFNPSIAANSAGELVLSFTRSGTVSALGTSTSGSAGAYAVVGTWSGATTTFGTPMQLQDGLANNYHLFNGSPERWGDFSYVSVDPSDTNSFWLINEFVQSGGTGTGSGAAWADNITQITVTPVPEPAGLTLLAAAAAAAVAARRRRHILRNAESRA